jgi:hypothetical protein
VWTRDRDEPTLVPALRGAPCHVGSVPPRCNPIAVRAVACAVIGFCMGGCDDARLLRPRDWLDFPVGQGALRGYYDAQPFGANQHLGSDWNDVRGGDSDLGAPVAAISAGRVVFSGDVGGGWGNVVRIVHPTLDQGAIESVSAHLDRIDVVVGQVVRRGESIGTIGTAGGQYPAHLHFELRTRVGHPLGGGYGMADGHVDPRAWIDAHRPPAP